jgi:hypothetical protein
MRTNFKYHITLLVVVILGLGCTKELPYTQDNFKPIIVVNSIWEVGQPVKFNLSSSIGILADTNQVLIENAIGNIRSNGIPLPLQNIGGGDYTSPLLCQEGVTYDIVMSAPGFDAVVATEVSPTNIVASLPDSTDIIIQNHLINIDIDDGLETNYYLIDVKAQRYKLFFDPVTFELDSTLVLEAIPFGNLNKIFLSDLEIVSKRTSFELFDDRLFNGKQYQLQIEVPVSSSLRTVERSEVHHYVVSIRSISPSYFSFLKNFLISRPIYGGPFESYREIPTNVLGGAGVFGIFSQVKDTVFISK